MKYFLLLVLCAFCASANAQFPLNNPRLIAHYPFNGNFNDVSGNGNHATSNGNMTFVNDKWGNANSAALFDGIDDYLELPLYDLTKKSFTILFMFRYDTAVNQFLFHKGGPASGNPAHQFSIYHSNPATPNRLGYNLTFNTTCPGSSVSTSLNGPGTHTTNQWYCVGYSYQRDSAIVRLHVYNVAAHASFYVASQKIDTCDPHPLLVGKWTQISPSFFKGALDEIRIYDSAFLGSSIIPSPSTNVFGPYCDQPPLLMQTFTDTLQCPGRSFNVGYSGGLFYSGNVVTVQLSDAGGSFANPLAIGSATTTSTPGTISCTIPPTTAPGTGYRIRLASSNLAQTSLDNGKNIRITSYPTVVTTATSPVCAGNTINFSTTGTAGVIYSWSGPGSFISSLQNPVITNAAVTATGDYVVTATQYTCSSKDTVSVLVHPIPAIPVAGSNTPVCPNTPINLTASNVAGATYSWSGPSSFSSALQNPVISNAAAANAGTYSVTATANGCTSAAGTTNVVVATPPATYTAGSNSPVCAGGTLNLTVSNMAGAIFNWSGPNGYAATMQNPSITPVPLNAGGTYSVYATLNGCQYPTVTTNVMVNNVSSLGVYPSPNDTVCIDKPNANLVAVPFNAGTSPQYQWYKNNTLIGGATSITYPATGIADGDSFYCRMTVTGLCADPLVLYSNKVGMTVLPLTAGPTISITADPGTLLSPWQLVKFTAVATNAGAIPKYQWKRNSQDVLGATSNVWSANNLSNGDTISCVVTSDVWCASPANEMSNRMVVNIKTGITDIDGGGKIELYPNPNNGSFVVYLPFPPLPTGQAGSRGGYVSVDVVDALGRTVYSKQQSQIANHQLEIQLPASVANGVYMLKLSADGVVYHARFTVSR